ncbi:surface-anchored protein [Actinobaculum suis]|uniref:Choice-of-anchor M domain-containing protein n=1 Tax=Actinobaculum suis TaxID=1657 RepID=A0A1G7CCS2_9ACTO|nr:choice-of-anchor M domain-containing protein [Actinobaculum suis]MDY5152939.1 choice-of-anchor M domain-containing protein [Actinobaculum suis]SDE36195.1 surface-anchored protein [Actinobaculum suis]
MRKFHALIAVGALAFTSALGATPAFADDSALTDAAAGNGTEETSTETLRFLTDEEYTAAIYGQTGNEADTNSELAPASAPAAGGEASQANTTSRPVSEDSPFGAHLGKTITTAAHVDAPKVFWENGKFQLYNEAKSVNYPLGQTANWLGKGYTRANNQGSNLHIFEPGNEPMYNYVSQVSDRWWRAPAVAGPGNTPIWAGFGADAKIPTQNFRDGAFWLELVDFDGPGRMEMMAIGFDNVNHLLSSHDPANRAALLVPGAHSHNETIFSKPGVYTLTYRAVARGKDGAIIASDPVPFTWYVGGVDPTTQPNTPLADRYNAAGEGDTSKYSFSVGPNSTDKRSWADGDDKFSTLTFNAGDSTASGTVAFFLDGYFLTEVPVQNGVGTYNEMLGSTKSASTLQAVFVPADNSHGRWVSTGIEYTPGEQLKSVNQMASAWPQKASRDKAPAFTTNTYKPSGKVDYTISTQISEDGDQFTTTVKLSDPNLRGEIKGGWYRNADSPASDQPFEGSIGTNGELSLVDDTGWLTDHVLKFTFVPTPEMDVAAAIGQSSWKLDDSQPQSSTAELYTAAGNPVNAAFDNTVTLDGTGSGATTGEGEGEEGSGNADEPGATDDSQNGSVPGTGEAGGTDSGAGSGNDAGSGNGSGEGNGDGNAAKDEEDSGGGFARPQFGDEPITDPLGSSHKNPFQKPVLLTKGHVDIGAAPFGDSITGFVHDDTAQHAKGSVYRTIDSVTLAVPDSTLKTRGAKGPLASKDFDFLGKPGTEFYNLGQTFDGTHVWPGWSTTKFGWGSVKLTLDPVEKPEGSNVFVYQYDGVKKQLDMLINTAEGDTTIDIPEPTHAHGSWAFTKPGAYKFNVVFETQRGVKSKPQTLTFLVGDQAVAGYKAGAVPQGAGVGTTDQGAGQGDGQGADADKGGSGGQSGTGNDAGKDGTGQDGSEQGDGNATAPGANAGQDGTDTGTGNQPNNGRKSINDLVDALNGGILQF